MADELYNIVRDRYNYNSETGWLTWKNCKYQKKNGMRAGSLIKSTGYRTLNINNKTYKEHRIIWLWYNGYLPETGIEIDHWNRIKDDNKISNLREKTHSCNQKNKGIGCDNKTGIVGVPEPRNGKYEPNIRNNKGKRIYLNCFDTLIEAVKARYKAEVKYNYENCNSTSTTYQYIKDNDPEWLKGEMEVNKSNSNKSSGIKGICFHKQSNKWEVYIYIDKKRINFGLFDKSELDDAVTARYEAEVKYNRTKNSQAYDYLIERDLI